MVAPERGHQLMAFYCGLRGVLVYRQRIDGLIYDQSLHFVVAFCVVLEISAIPIFFFLAKKQNGLAH